MHLANMLFDIVLLEVLLIGGVDLLKLIIRKVAIYVDFWLWDRWPFGKRGIRFRIGSFGRRKVLLRERLVS